MKHLFICLWAIRIFLGEKFLFKSFIHLKIQLLFFLLLLLLLAVPGGLQDLSSPIRDQTPEHSCESRKVLSTESPGNFLMFLLLKTDVLVAAKSSAH